MLNILKNNDKFNFCKIIDLNMKVLIQAKKKKKLRIYKKIKISYYKIYIKSKRKK